MVRIEEVCGAQNFGLLKAIAPKTAAPQANTIIDRATIPSQNAAARRLRNLQRFPALRMSG